MHRCLYYSIDALLLLMRYFIVDLSIDKQEA